MEGKEFKQESSIVVSSRVSMIDLANLDRYWHSEEVPIRSMSALVSASLALLVDVLRHNEALREEIKTVHDAHRWLISRRLYQPSLTKRNRQKISTALKKFLKQPILLKEMLYKKHIMFTKNMVKTVLLMIPV